MKRDARKRVETRKRAVMIALAALTGSMVLGCQVSCSLSEWDVWRKKISLDVIYEPTSYPLVEEMLEMAGVGPEDLVYDLGCGDGRIVIMAAKHRGAKGIGVDLDPNRIRESLRNAESRGVTDHVRFYEQDLFDADISEATVVMLYLFPGVNLRLRPKLLKELTPGTRIVSHSHTMGEWEAESVRKVHGRDLHLFVVPANVTGTWQGRDSEGRLISLALTQRFQRVKGILHDGVQAYPVGSCTLQGEQLSFRVERTQGGAKRMLFFNGRVSGDIIEERIVHEGGDHAGEKWTGAREPFTSVSIAE